MNCQECHDYIDAYIDNELDIASTILVKHHLRDCLECRQLLEPARPWELYSTIRRFDLKSQIRFWGGFNLLFRFLDPLSSNDPAVDLSFPGSRFR
jgi:hypothetical protein